MYWLGAQGPEMGSKVICGGHGACLRCSWLLGTTSPTAGIGLSLRASE